MVRRQAVKSIRENYILQSRFHVIVRLYLNVSWFPPSAYSTITNNEKSQSMVNILNCSWAIVGPIFVTYSPIWTHSGGGEEGGHLAISRTGLNYIFVKQNIKHSEIYVYIYRIYISLPEKTNHTVYIYIYIYTVWLVFQGNDI